mgnify:CR=1 FL=1
MQPYDCKCICNYSVSQSITDSRSAAEILDEADFTFRLNWGFHEARGREQTIPGMNEFVAYERYVSLNWITGVVDQWEDE